MKPSEFLAIIAPAIDTLPAANIIIPAGARGVNVKSLPTALNATPPIIAPVEYVWIASILSFSMAAASSSASSLPRAISEANW